MRETSKLYTWRLNHGYQEFFKGHGIDIGSGDDPLKPTHPFSFTCEPFDKIHGNNAETCDGLASNRYDFVYSSHCLEHLDSPVVALTNWIRICKPGGHIVFAVPHEVYYEKLRWPSQFNGDHKTSWRLGFETDPRMTSSICLPQFIKHYFARQVDLLRCQTILLNFDFDRFFEDQTTGEAVCQIEVVLRKKKRDDQMPHLP